MSLNNEGVQNLKQSEFCKCYEEGEPITEGTLLNEFDGEKSYSWYELSLMTEVCASCGKVIK